MNIQSQHHRNIKKLFWITFFQNWIFAYVIERVFAVARGFTIMEIQTIGVIFSLASLILEVPCGALADRWKKKYVLSLGLAICTMEFVISIFAYDFPTLSLAFLLAAVGCSLKSGIVDSMLYEELAQLGQTDRYEHVMGRLRFMKYMISGLAAILGGYMAEWRGLEYPYWMSLIGLLSASALTLTLYEPKQKSYSQASHSAGIRTHIQQSLQIMKSDPSLFHIMLFSALIESILHGQLYEISSLVYGDIGIQVSQFGYVSLSIMIAGSLSGVVIARLKDRMGYLVLFGGIVGISIISLLLFSYADRWWHILYLVICIFAMEMTAPLTTGYLQRCVNDQIRVTISSIDSFLTNGLTMITCLIFGWTADHFGIFQSFRMMAGFLLISTTLLSIYQLTVYSCYRKRNKTNSHS